MSEEKKTTPKPSRADPVPASDGAAAEKGKPPPPEGIVVREVTKTGRSWTFIGTRTPRRNSPQ